MQLALRRATAADSAFAYEVKKAAFAPYVEQVWGRWDEEVQRELHQRRFSVHQTSIVEIGELDVGILVMAHEPDCLYVHQLFILPEYQSRGIGGACIARVIADADASRLPIKLRVLKANDRAIEFYRRLGFELSGESETHVTMERRSQPFQAPRAVP